MTPEVMAGHLSASVSALTQRVEQTLRLLEEERGQLKQEREEAKASLRLAQDFVAKVDETVEHLATVAAALTTLETRMRDLLTTLAALSRRGQPNK